MKFWVALCYTVTMAMFVVEVHYEHLWSSVAWFTAAVVLVWVTFEEMTP